ncbi:hypothetical protein HHI36_014728 [Cryptolaemus montrouzieri]|uniref:Uncharacterized protein n=1 Tax=Cryptolaemus montrouzieri TaxID=559131 RepID=A0ABD2N4M7_9CUCU
MVEEPEIIDLSQTNLIEISAGVNRKLKIIAVSIYRPPYDDEEIFLYTMDRLLESQKGGLCGGDIDYQKTVDKMNKVFIGPPPPSVTVTGEENEPERRNDGYA